MKIILYCSFSQRIKLGNLLAPVARVGHSYYPVLEFLNYFDVGYPKEHTVGALIWSMLGAGEFAPHNWVMDLIAKSEQYFCNHLPAKLGYYCKMVYETAIFLDGGFDYDEVSF